MKDMMELDADYYKNNSASQYSQASQMLKLINIQDNFSILDVGCGHGNILAELSVLVPNGKALGIDSSHNMISLAKSSFPSEISKNLFFKPLNAEKIEILEQHFDLITCTNGLC